MRPREQVEDQVRRAIFAGELRSGEKLPPESELARQFGVSRTTVREALRALSTQGLIQKAPGANGGSFILSVDYKSLGVQLQEAMHNLIQLGNLEFDEVAAARQYLEVPAARLAARNREDRDLRILDRIVQLERDATISDPEISELDARFHGTIALASGNRVLAAFVHALHRETEPVHFLDLSSEVGRETVRQHGAIVAAISRREPDAAEVAMVNHLTYLRRHVNQPLAGSTNRSSDVGSPLNDTSD